MDKERITAAALMGNHKGRLENYMGTGWCEDPSCHDVLQYYISAKREIITEIFYTITEKSCIPSKACGEIAAQLAEGKPIMEAYTITAAAIAEALGGMDQEYFHCAQMAELALKRAVLDYAKRRAAV